MCGSRAARRDEIKRALHEAYATAKELGEEVAVTRRSVGELRQALAVREQEDLDAGRVLSVPQFKQRVAQILNVWSVPKTGETHSILQKLVRGMPKRLAKCQQNRYGRCGK